MLHRDGHGAWRGRHAPWFASVGSWANTDSLKVTVATHLLEGGYDMRTVQELQGHADASTIMFDTHVLNAPELAVKSPADA